MKIVTYTPEYQKHFEQLNRAWIEKYFTMEPMDEALLLHPEEKILKKGGAIFFVEHQYQIIGTVALKFVETNIYELAKMAVDERYQGLGAGKLLCQTAIDEARKLKADKIILYTNAQLKKALGIYHKFGFQKVPIEGQEYHRADTKMELLLVLNTPQWFERKFTFDLGNEKFPELLERLESGVLKFRTITQNISNKQINYKPFGKWSIKEHLGHLWILEFLWQKRFIEIKENKTEMSPADLNNTATNKALFNQYNIDKLLDDLEQERQITIQLLRGFKGNDFEYSLFHPRLNQPMRVIDLMFFVVEHDAHHCHAILNLCNQNIHI